LGHRAWGIYMVRKKIMPGDCTGARLWYLSPH
jgi:hypothetical protein